MPPKEKNIQLGPGQLYINGEPVGSISEASLEGAEVPEELPEIVRASCSGAFTATIECNEAFIEKLKAMQQAAQEYAQRIIDYYIEITLDACPNPRVVHLVRNGRKARTRKKNWRRAERYYYETKEEAKQ